MDESNLEYDHKLLLKVGDFSLLQIHSITWKYKILL